MKKVMLLVVLAMALPMGAFASSQVDYSNVGGTLTGSSSGLSLSGSTLVAVSGLNGGGLITGNNLGTVSFTTGTLLSGSIKLGGVFNGGGSFTITGNGSNGVPSGVLFAGTFSGPVTWQLLHTPKNNNYVLTGTLVSTNGGTTGATTQITFSTGSGKRYFNGSLSLGSGNTTTVVPEPGTLSLLGTGLLGLAGVIRRQLKA